MLSSITKRHFAMVFTLALTLGCGTSQKPDPELAKLGYRVGKNRVLFKPVDVAAYYRARGET